MTHQDALNDIIPYVRKRYARLARTSANSGSNECSSTQGCCCSSTSMEQDKSPQVAFKGYQPNELASLPEDITSFSLGCGDPVALAGLQAGQVVMDLGSGGGLDCFLAAKIVGTTGRVIGIDMTPEMLERGRANKAKIGAENVEFRLGEIEHLPAGDNSVDVIISNCVINLSPDKAQVFREAFRVLKPGGKLAVSDIVTDGQLPQEVKDNMSAWAGCVAGALDVSDYIAAIETAGFTQVELVPEYWEKEMVAQMLNQLGESIDLDSIPKEKIYRAVFSARITALKPSHGR